MSNLFFFFGNPAANEEFLIDIALLPTDCSSLSNSYFQIAIFSYKIITENLIT